MYMKETKYKMYENWAYKGILRIKIQRKQIKRVKTAPFMQLVIKIIHIQ